MLDPNYNPSGSKVKFENNFAIFYDEVERDRLSMSDYQDYLNYKQQKLDELNALTPAQITQQAQLQINNQIAELEETIIALPAMPVQIEPEPLPSEPIINP